MKEIIITTEYAGGRLDKFLFRYLDGAAKNFIYKMLRKKNITLNGQKASGGELLSSGDVVRLFLSDETVSKFRSKNNILPAKNCNPDCDRDFKSAGEGKALSNLICYEDENIIAINKPFGILSQKANPADYSLNEMLFEYLSDRNNESSLLSFKPGISNRLDRNTTGIVLAGKNPNAARLLNAAIKNRCLSKKYYCIVHGVLDGCKTIEAYVKKNEKTNKVLVSDTDFDGSEKKIITAYRHLSDNGALTFLEIDLITGKSHQIRAHLASISHPVLGDNKYGGSFKRDGLENRYKIRAQLLHAGKIEFNSMPGDLSYLNGTKIKAKFPQNFVNVLEGEGLWLPGTAEV